MYLLHLVSHHVYRRARAYGSGIAILGVVVAFLLLLPPFEFPRGVEIEVRDDASFDETATMLKEAGVIRSALVFKVVARIGQADRALQAGRYLFSEPVGVTTVLFRLVHGISGIPSARVTFPEGYTAREMAETLTESIPGFDGRAFLAEATQEEGYLFPDTYLFPYDVTPTEVVARMRATFDTRSEELSDVLPLSSRSLDQIVIMASILEKEAKTEEEMRTVAGILWNRVELNRGLQVDAVFGYIKGIDTYHPSGEDLDIDSPYNTYKYPGLPPGPIGNPGLTALRAALSPVDTSYLYYLTGRDGKMYYATTFEEHKKNRELYLD